MVQGLSVGGEYTTSIVFMVEQAAPGRRGMLGAMAGCGAVGGILLGSAGAGAFPSLPGWSSASRVICSEDIFASRRSASTSALRSPKRFARMARCWHGWRDSPPSTPSASICCSSIS